MRPVEQAINSLTDGRRATWLWDTKLAASAVGCVPNKFGDWWGRTEDKLIELFVAMPGETAAELAALFAKAEMVRQQRQAEAAGKRSA